MPNNLGPGICVAVFIGGALWFSLTRPSFVDVPSDRFDDAHTATQNAMFGPGVSELRLIDGRVVRLEGMIRYSVDDPGAIAREVNRLEINALRSDLQDENGRLGFEINRLKHVVFALNAQDEALDKVISAQAAKSDILRRAVELKLRRDCVCKAPPPHEDPGMTHEELLEDIHALGFEPMGSDE